MEPMEALRYLPYLHGEGWVVSSSAPFKNIPNYPSDEDLDAEYRKLPQSVTMDIDT